MRVGSRKPSPLEARTSNRRSPRGAWRRPSAAGFEDRDARPISCTPILPRRPRFVLDSPGRVKEKQSECYVNGSGHAGEVMYRGFNLSGLRFEKEPTGLITRGRHLAKLRPRRREEETRCLRHRGWGPWPWVAAVLVGSHTARVQCSVGSFPASHPRNTT